MLLSTHPYQAHRFRLNSIIGLCDNTAIFSPGLTTRCNFSDKSLCRSVCTLEYRSGSEDSRKTGEFDIELEGDSLKSIGIAETSDSPAADLAMVTVRRIPGVLTRVEAFRGFLGDEAVEKTSSPAPTKAVSAIDSKELLLKLQKAK